MIHRETMAGIVIPAALRAGRACLITIYGRDLGRRWMLDAPSLVIGRGDGCDVILDRENVSRRHCELRCDANGTYSLEDLRSTNGTFVNNEEITAPRILRNNDQINVGGTIFKFLDGDGVEARFHEEIYRMTIVDGLTGAHNKRYLLEFLEREMSRCHRYGRLLSLLMVDIDHFKQVNDTHGHIAGDRVLVEVAANISRMVRREECFARYGGEEFALVLPEAERSKVLVFAEKIRATTEALETVFEDRSIRVTVSVGFAQMTESLTDPQAFLAAADEKLYRAKKEGRNRVVV